MWLHFSEWTFFEKCDSWRLQTVRKCWSFFDTIFDVGSSFFSWSTWTGTTLLSVVMVQWALQKKGYRRNSYSYVGRVPCKKAKFPNRNSLGIKQSSLCRAVITSCSLINESHTGLPSACHYEFISWKPMHLKSPISFNHPILFIKPIRCTDVHPPQPANTGSACQWCVVP